MRRANWNFDLAQGRDLAVHLRDLLADFPHEKFCQPICAQGRPCPNSGRPRSRPQPLWRRSGLAFAFTLVYAGLRRWPWPWPSLGPGPLAMGHGPWPLPSPSAMGHGPWPNGLTSMRVHPCQVICSICRRNVLAVRDSYIYIYIYIYTYISSRTVG